MRSQGRQPPDGSWAGTNRVRAEGGPECVSTRLAGTCDQARKGQHGQECRVIHTEFLGGKYGTRRVGVALTAHRILSRSLQKSARGKWEKEEIVSVAGLGGACISDAVHNVLSNCACLCVFSS